MSGIGSGPPRSLGGYTRLAALVLVVVSVTALVPSTGKQVLQADSRASGAPGSSTAASPTGGGTPAVDGAVPDGPGGTGGPPRPGDPGVVVPGSGCPDRTVQIPGDPYSPPCIPFSGDNGGATSRGVTAETITVTWRLTDEAAAASAVASAVGSGVEIGDTRADVVRTLEGLVDYVNEHFQLYGRTIDLEIFEGLGSNSDENSGTGQDLVNADAVTVATQIGAFADVSTETALFTDALARRGVLGIGMNAVSDEWYQERHPFAWGMLSCTDIVRHAADYANRRLFGRNADDAGDGLVGQPRRIALLAPENPYFQDCARRFVSEAAAAGNQMAGVLTYALDLNTLSRDTSSLIARLSQDRITTVVLFTDPVAPLFLTAKASQQRYYPEWVITGLALTDDDRVAQFYDQSQWQHAFGLRTLTPSFAKQSSVPYAAFKSVRPDEEPAGLALLYSAYTRLYSLALGVQMAGPNLTPETFAAGWQSYPGGGGFAGMWRGRPGSHTFQVDAEEAYWDPGRTSPANGAQGAYVTTSPRFEVGQLPPGPPTVSP